MRRSIAILLCAVLAAPGCAATARAARTPQTGVQTQKPATGGHPVLAESVQQLPVGSRVAVTFDDNRRIRGTLLKATAETVVVQARTRVPEPPIEIKVERLQRVDLEKEGGSVGRSMAIGAAVGAGTALGILLLLAAIFAD